MPWMSILILCLGVAPLGCGLAPGPDCDRAGCDAGDEPTDSGIAVGVAGVAFSVSDVVANGCQECGLTQGTLRIWAADSAITDREAAVALVTTGEPLSNVDVDERYEQMLDPGSYAVCNMPDMEGVCVAVEVKGDEVTTVHLRYVLGPPGIVVFDPGSDRERTDGIYEINYGDWP